MESDTRTRDDVLAESRWDPAVDEPGRGVIVKDGNVTSTGHLSSFAENNAAGRVVQRLIDVKGVAGTAVVPRGKVHALAKRYAARGAA